MRTVPNLESHHGFSRKPITFVSVTHRVFYRYTSNLTAAVNILEFLPGLLSSDHNYAINQEVATSRWKCNGTSFHRLNPGISRRPYWSNKVTYHSVGGCERVVIWAVKSNLQTLSKYFGNVKPSGTSGNVNDKAGWCLRLCTELLEAHCRYPQYFPSPTPWPLHQ